MTRIDSGMSSIAAMTQGTYSVDSPVSRTPASAPVNAELGSLTKSDFDLVYQATGQRIDASSQVFPMFAVQLANDRRNGTLSPQGPVSADYLANLRNEYANTPWMVDQASRALDWVQQRGGQSGVDVTA